MTIAEHWDSAYVINSCALQQGLTMLQIIKLMHPEWGIESITGRVKSKESLIEKALSRGITEYLENDSDSYYNEIQDEVALRVIVEDQEDVPKIAETIKTHANYTFKKEKNYLAFPKKNGYRSLHLYGWQILGGTNLGTKLVMSEIQLRTLPQHNWASVEHGTRYKIKYESISPEVDDVIQKIASICEIDSYRDDESIAALAHILNKNDMETNEMLVHLNSLLSADNKELVKEKCRCLLSGILDIRNNNYNELAEIGVQMDRVTSKICANTDERALLLSSLRRFDMEIGPDKVVSTPVANAAAENNAEANSVDHTSIKAAENSLQKINVGAKAVEDSQ